MTAATRLDPADPLDAAIDRCGEPAPAHATRDLVRRSGRTAARDRARAASRRVGYSVVQGASDWVFGPDDREIQTEVLYGMGRRGARGRRAFARRYHRLARPPPRSRSRPDARRFAVGHVDFFAHADRHALSRQIAVEQHFVADLVRPHRRCAAPDRHVSIGGKDNAGRARSRA